MLVPRPCFGYVPNNARRLNKLMQLMEHSMPSKFQQERRKKVAMMIYKIEQLLLSSKVVGKKRTSKASK